jgi:hypothetical protein
MAIDNRFTLDIPNRTWTILSPGRSYAIRQQTKLNISKARLIDTEAIPIGSAGIAHVCAANVVRPSVLANALSNAMQALHR